MEELSKIEQEFKSRLDSVCGSILIKTMTEWMEEWRDNRIEELKYNHSPKTPLKEKIIELSANGFSSREIGKELGVSHTTVIKIVAKNKIVTNGN